MTTPTVVGNKNGIMLWNLIATSSDSRDKSEYARLSAAASKYGVVWFTDTVTQSETNQNQVVWMMQWDGDKNQWEFSNFMTPAGAPEVTERMKKAQEKEEPVEEIVEMDIEDLIEYGEDEE